MALGLSLTRDIHWSLSMLLKHNILSTGFAIHQTIKPCVFMFMTCVVSLFSRQLLSHRDIFFCVEEIVGHHGIFSSFFSCRVSLVFLPTFLFFHCQWDFFSPSHRFLCLLLFRLSCPLKSFLVLFSKNCLRG